MKADCLFCKIAAGQVPATIVFQDEMVVAFNDIHPAAPVHVLIVPRQHVASVAELGPDGVEVTGQLIMHAKKLAEQLKIDASGYRLVFNVRQHGGQFVDHLHLHLLGGQQLGHLA